MIEVVGDMWTYPADVRCITINGFVKNDGSAVMGRGVAAQAARKYWQLPRDLGVHLKEHGLTCMLLAAEYLPSPGLIMYPVKYNWWETADLDLIAHSAKELVQIANRHPEWKSVLLPRPGCGNGGLRWDDVRYVIAPILLSDRYLVIDR